MFEQWADKADPTVRLVVRAGEALPAELGARDWLLMGSYSPDPKVAAEITERGFAFIRSTENLPDPDRLKDSNAAGA